MATKRCGKCQLVKSVTEFNKNTKDRDGLRNSCKMCCQNTNAVTTQRGLDILQSLAMTQGCCKLCQRPYTNEDWYFFEFDHIDPSLKQSKKETEARWVSGHQDEFFQRVALNLQLLCIKCHKIKTSKELQLGGAVHQKKFGVTKPAEVVELGWNLFTQPPTLEDFETYSYHLREGDWITVRDINGKLISYEHHTNFIKTN
jgi:hypothetical protein